MQFAPKEVVAPYRCDGTILLRSPIALTGVAANMVDHLEEWATQTPDRVFLAQRGGGGDWEELTYRVAWRRVQGVAQALLDMGLTSATPIAILSAASIEHGILTFAGMLAGIPVAPVSPNYSQLPNALPRLVDIAEVLAPALVFAQRASAYANARSLPQLAGARWMSATPGEPDAVLLSDLYDTAPTARLDAVRRSVTPDTVAKILFTSGSTGAPKGVINTQGMICSATAASALLVTTEEAPVLLDWLPWHHTMGGNATQHGVLRAGGSLYIDDGRPTPSEFGKTLENIRRIRPTSLLSVPAALQMLVTALETDADLRTAFFSRLSRLSFAGASLPQDIWERIQALAVGATGAEVPFGSGYGATETGPGISATHWPSRGGGEIGLPGPGLTLKLVPVEDRYEVRVQGPNVTPGYLERPDLTAAAFDEEGYYKVGDLVTFVDPMDPAQGLRFAGRLSENFKLTNGSWVTTGELRLAALEACQPLASDVVIAGHDRDDVRLLIWIDPGERQRAGGMPEGRLDPASYESLADRLAVGLKAFNTGKHGATQRIAAFRILHDAPSLGAGETTDKGYVNQRGVLQRRADLVDDLYAASPGPEVRPLQDQRR
ncbi:AMP-binding protein [Phenylobacterium sp.]|uniref:AMP-binding protein n=1 Tax=Phenylobacterium sp. TaxID=1871053 RepID=UPI0025E70407|nr:AMP-binding protein [Phenylobacterium sp.]